MVDRRAEARPLFLTITFALAPFLGALSAALVVTGHQPDTGWTDTAQRLIPSGLILVTLGITAHIMDRLFAAWAKCGQEMTTEEPKKRIHDPWSSIVSTMYFTGFITQVIALIWFR